MPAEPTVSSRRDQQQRTRKALIVAALQAFARDGYHGARLDAIAREAGFSKGAVYSNFANKAELFLAVVDFNLVSSDAPPYATGSHATDSTHADADAEHPDAIRGFALATLEFIAVAARDPQLQQESARRVNQLIEFYATSAQTAGADPDLADRERGALLAALDQGAAVLQLAGAEAMRDRGLQIGLSRLAGGSVDL